MGKSKVSQEKTLLPGYNKEDGSSEESRLEISLPKPAPYKYIYSRENAASLTIMFDGQVDSLFSWDSASFCYEMLPEREKDPVLCQYQFPSDSSILIRQESFPPRLRKTAYRAGVIFTEGALFLITEMKITVLDKSSLQITPLSKTPWEINTQAGYLANQVIRDRVSTLLKNLPNICIEIGKYPLFLEYEGPSAKRLETLYESYKQNNDQLKAHYKATKGYCTGRAEAVCQFLEGKGISALKLFVQWGENSPSNAHYHCAAGIFDDLKELKVWDPWISFYKPDYSYKNKLLSLEEWLAYPPQKILIANPIVTFDFHAGLEPPCGEKETEDGENFDKAVKATLDFIASSKKLAKKRPLSPTADGQNRYKLFREAPVGPPSITTTTSVLPSPDFG